MMLLETMWQAFWTGLLAAMEERPLFWGALAVAWLAGALWAYEALERRGWRATLWACLCAGALGLWLALS